MWVRQDVENILRREFLSKKKRKKETDFENMYWTHFNPQINIDEPFRWSIFRVNLGYNFLIFSFAQHISIIQYKKRINSFESE